ncbi:MAG: hypothetical protein IKZ58_00910 [Selenomonadaceae bacterium]|nr:hypothetical protein [Selenomonadaceae bacterium]
MFKKCFAAIMTLALLLFTTSVTGECYGTRGANEPLYNADKAVLAYAEAYAYGSTVYANEAGLAQSDIYEVRNVLVRNFKDNFKDFCLSDATLNKITDVYFNKLRNSMDISTKLKVGDADHPVITLKAKILDDASFEYQAVNDKNLQALVFANAGLKEKGKTCADLKVDPTYQAAAVEAITNFINGLDFGSTKIMDVTCEKVMGADGKVYWAPQDPASVLRFIQADYPMTGR